MFGDKIGISGEKRRVFGDKTGISWAEYHILGESYYFSEKTSYFWLKNGICERKLVFLVEKMVFVGGNGSSW